MEAKKTYEEPALYAMAFGVCETFECKTKMFALVYDWQTSLGYSHEFEDWRDTQGGWYDSRGRYCFSNQDAVQQWLLFCIGEAEECPF